MFHIAAQKAKNLRPYTQYSTLALQRLQDVSYLQYLSVQHIQLPAIAGQVVHLIYHLPVMLS